MARISCFPDKSLILLIDSPESSLQNKALDREDQFFVDNKSKEDEFPCNSHMPWFSLKFEKLIASSVERSFRAGDDRTLTHFIFAMEYDYEPHKQFLETLDTAVQFYLKSKDHPNDWKFQTIACSFIEGNKPQEGFFQSMMKKAMRKIASVVTESKIIRVGDEIDLFIDQIYENGLEETAPHQIFKDYKTSIKMTPDGILCQTHYKNVPKFNAFHKRLRCECKRTTLFVHKHVPLFAKLKNILLSQRK